MLVLIAKCSQRLVWARSTQSWDESHIGVPIASPESLTGPGGALRRKGGSWHRKILEIRIQLRKHQPWEGQKLLGNNSFKFGN